MRCEKIKVHFARSDMLCYTHKRYSFQCRGPGAHEDLCTNGACVHYVMKPKFQWKPSWLATQWDPQNDWTGWQIVYTTTTYWHRSHPQIVILSKEQYSTGGAEFIHQFRSYASQRQKINPGCWRGAAHVWDSHAIQPVLWSVHRSAGGTLPAALTYCNTFG